MTIKIPHQIAKPRRDFQGTDFEKLYLKNSTRRANFTFAYSIIIDKLDMPPKALLHATRHGGLCVGGVIWGCFIRTRVTWME